MRIKILDLTFFWKCVLGILKIKTTNGTRNRYSNTQTGIGIKKQILYRIY